MKTCPIGALAALACIPFLSCQQPDATYPPEKSNSLSARIHRLGRPARRFVRQSIGPAQGREDAALRGEFSVFGKPVELIPPIDWTQDPFRDKSWRFYLHTLDHIRVLYHLYSENESLAALRLAADMVLDWIRSNPFGGSGISEFAWNDMVVGIRAPYLAYLLRAGTQAGILSDQEIFLLASSLGGHGRFLADGHNYASDHNHGLFEDAGLFLLADYSPFIEQSRRWKELASARFVSTLKRTIQPGEFVHLEHSPTYHILVTNLADDLRTRVGIGDQSLDYLIEELKDRAGWFVMPDGRLPCVGDTGKQTAPDWAKNLGKQGLMVFPGAGYAIVKRPDSYLALFAGFHSTIHKHQDELTFCLADSQGRIIVDSGHSGYNPGPGRQYSLSPRAHNVLALDGWDIPLGRLKPYGSGILASGEGDGWFAFEGRNPLLEQRGVRHQRLLLYRPGYLLLVIDRVESDENHHYTRYFHFDPALQLEAGESGAQIRGDFFVGSIQDWSDADTKVVLVRGRPEPEMQGWVFTNNRQPVESYVIEFKNQAASRTFVTSIALTDTPARILMTQKDDLSARVSIDDGHTTSQIRVQRRGPKLILSVGPTAD